MSVFEPLGGILSANLPVTYALCKRISTSIKSSRSGSGSGNTGGSSGIGNQTFGAGCPDSNKRGSGGAPVPGMYGANDLDNMTFSELETQRGWSVCAIDVVDAAAAGSSKKQPVTITTQIEVDIREDKDCEAEAEGRKK